VILTVETPPLTGLVVLVSGHSHLFVCGQTYPNQVALSTWGNKNDTYLWGWES
jgi:hypothetical protein